MLAPVNTTPTEIVIESPRDPRLRLLAFALLVGAVLFALRSIGSMLVVFGYVVALYAVSGGRVRELAAHLRRLLLFFVIIVAINGWAVAGAPAWEVGGKTILSKEGLASGVFYCVRLAVIYLSMVVLFITTPPYELAAAVFATVRPVSASAARRLAFYGFVSMSFVPMFSLEFQRVRVAQSFRGAGLTTGLTGGFANRVHSVRLLIVPLILSAIHRSGQLAMVTELRGLKDRVGEILVVRPVSAGDFVLPLVTLAVVVAAAWIQ